MPQVDVREMLDDDIEAADVVDHLLLVRLVVVVENVVGAAPDEQMLPSEQDAPGRLLHLMSVSLDNVIMSTMSSLASISNFTW